LASSAAFAPAAAPAPRAGESRGSSNTRAQRNRIFYPVRGSGHEATLSLSRSLSLSLQKAAIPRVKRLARKGTLYFDAKS